MSENRHTQATPAETLALITTKLEEIQTLLTPYNINLSQSDRARMLRLGEKTLAFVEKAHDYAVQTPALVPSILDMADFNADFADAHSYWTIINLAEQVLQALENIENSAGSEAYQAALIFYNYVKVAAKEGIPGAEAIYDDLKSRFPGSKRKNGDSETETETLTETVKKTVSVT